MNAREFIKKFLLSRGYSLTKNGCLHTHALSLQLSELLTSLKSNYVIDVGGNTGQYRNFIRRVIGYTGKGCSVEPIPGFAKKIRDEAANDEDWTIYECALGSRKGELEINLQGELSSFLELNKTGREYFNSKAESRIKVPIDTLTSILPEYASNAFLKIDTQGYEIEVLKGAEEVLNKISIIQLEAPFIGIYQDQPSLSDIVDYMLSKQFLPAGIFRANVGGYPERMIDADMLFVRK